MIDITRDDLNEIKRIEDLLINENTTYLSIEPTFIQDMNQNSVAPLQSNRALQISNYTSDTTRPQIVAFDVWVMLGAALLFLPMALVFKSINRFAGVIYVLSLVLYTLWLLQPSLFG